MKKEERLHRLFGDIDDGLVAEATRRPVRKMVWMPIVAAAACVALTVGLWQGGVFGSEKLPVEAPNEVTSTTEPTEPTDTTTDTTTTTTEKSTTTTTTEPYILVGGEDDSPSRSNEGLLSLKDRLVSPVLEEKMNEYRDINAVYQVVFYLPYVAEDGEKADKLIEADAEYQSLKKQYEEAHKTFKEAVKRVYDCEYPDDDPRKDALRQEREDAEKKKNEISNEMSELRTELFEKFIDIVREERISYAAKYSKTEPIGGYGLFGEGYYVELTADAINELVDRGGYDLFLASKLDSYRLGYFDE